MKKDFTGVYTALITPFLDGAVDFDSLRKLIRFQLDNKIQGLVVSGSTGEAATLTLDEKIKLLEFVKNEVAGQVPVIMGSGTFNTAESCVLAQVFEKTKAEALLVVTPYYNKPPQRGLIEHYRQICKSTSLPIIAYNVPSRTALSMDVESVRLAQKECPNLIGVKEAAGKLDVISSLKEKMPPDFLVISGDDATFIEAIHLGAQGVISVISHVCPQICYDAALNAKNKTKAAEFTKRLAEISSVLFCESNPIPVKWALFKMGIIKSPEPRLPLVELDQRYQKTVSGALKNLGVL